MSGQTKRLNRPPSSLDPMVQLGFLSAADCRCIAGIGDAMRGPPVDPLRLAATYLTLAREGIDIPAMIGHMSRLGREAAPDWTRGRWVDESRRLPRALELHRTLAEAVDYALSAFRRNLPARWPGYLVTSAFQLAQQGMRLRTSALDGLDRGARAGTEAAVVVFVDRRRYVACLRQTRSQRVRIVRIIGHRARDGGAAPHVRARVESLLGLSFSSDNEHPCDAPPERVSALRMQLHLLCSALAAHRVTSVYADFSGGGDSGSVEDVDVVFDDAAPAFGEEAPPDTTQFLETLRVFEDGTDTTFDALIRQVVDTHLDLTGVDWYNGSGGGGEWTLDVERERVSLRVDQNYEDSSTAWDEEAVLIDDVLF